MPQPLKTWALPPPTGPLRLAEDIPAPIAAVLARRGVTTPEELSVFLDPPHHLPHNPLGLSGMDRAVARLYRSIEDGETVGVFGDFDVDGITGTAIIQEGLTGFGVPVVPYLPHRSEEGHGLSIPAIEQLAEQGISLLVTVDCGVTSIAEVDHARGLGMDVIISDHHTPVGGIPNAVAVVNPRMPGSRYPFGDLCGAGIAFKMVQGLYQHYGQPWPPELLELAALGTIADLVPLLDENRFLVRRGLEQMASTRRAGLQALFRQAAIDPARLDAGSISFQIAPRLNAAGRMSHAEESLRLLTTTSPDEAGLLAQRLEQLNLERRGLTERGFSAAVRQLDALSGVPPIIVVTDPVITPGVAGLVAGRLAERWGRPAVVMAEVEEDRLVASGRSVPGFNLVESFSRCASLLVRYGGHSQAAGFTIHRDNLPALRELLQGLAEEWLSGDETTNAGPVLHLDARLVPADLGPDLVGWLRQLEPFGAGNPDPVFLAEKMQVLESRPVGASGQHLRLQVYRDGHRCFAIAFNQADRWPSVPSVVDIAASVLVDHWNGVERTTLKVVDLRDSES